MRSGKALIELEDGEMGLPKMLAIEDKQVGDSASPSQIRDTASSSQIRVHKDQSSRTDQNKSRTADTSVDMEGSPPAAQPIGRPVTRVLPKPEERTPGCKACSGEVYYHLKHCPVGQREKDFKA